MVDWALNARRDQVLALVGEQQQMIVRLVTLLDLLTDQAGQGLDAATLDRFREGLNALGSQIKAEARDSVKIRAALVDALDHLGQDGERLREVLIRCRTGLDSDRQSLERSISDGRDLLARHNAIYVSAHEAALELLRTYKPIHDGARVDAFAALQAVASAYFKTGTADRAIWRTELERRTAGYRDSRTLPAEVLKALVRMPHPMAAPTVAAPIFDPTEFGQPCADAAAARARASALIAPLEALAREGTTWTDERLALANTALAHAMIAAITKVIEPVLGNSGYVPEIRIPQTPSVPTVTGLADAATAAVSQRMAVRQSRQEVGGSLARLGRWWRGPNSDWGYEVRTLQETRYYVAFEKFTAGVNRAIEQAEVKAAALSADALFETPIEETLQTVATRLTTLRESLRSGVDGSVRLRDGKNKARRGADDLIKALADHLRQVEASRAALDITAPGEAEDASEVTMVGDATMVGALSVSMMGNRLELTHGDRKATLAGTGGQLSLGRGQENSLVVTGPRVSRRHAEISFRDGAYTITDTSTNGTIILGDQQEPVMIKRGSEVLRGSGRIGLGVDPVQEPGQAIFFQCISPWDDR